MICVRVTAAEGKYPGKEYMAMMENEAYIPEERTNKHARRTLTDYPSHLLAISVAQEEQL